MRTIFLLLLISIEIISAAPSHQWGTRVDSVRRGPHPRIKESQEVPNPLVSEDEVKVVDYSTCMQGCERRYETLQVTNIQPDMTKEMWNEICSFLCYQAWGDFAETFEEGSDAETSGDIAFQPDKRVDGLRRGHWGIPLLSIVGKAFTQEQASQFPRAPGMTFGRLRTGGM